MGHGDAWTLLFVFVLLMAWIVRQSLRRATDAFVTETERELEGRKRPGMSNALMRTGFGLIVLILSSRLLVWSAVAIARGLGVAELVIGLTVVAVGTSLPELASSGLAALKGEDDLAVGNIVGSNLFNTLAVVGVAGTIRPLASAPEVLSRDLPAVGIFTLALFAVAYGSGGPGRVTRLEGGLLMAGYAGYLWILTH
jgi:cation:H+ antiporter